MNAEPTSWDRPQPFTLAARVGAEDIDGLEHTNNTVYVKWCEQVAWLHSVSLGLDLERYRELDRAMAITHSEYDYLQASREGLAPGTGPAANAGRPVQHENHPQDRKRGPETVNRTNPTSPGHGDGGGGQGVGTEDERNRVDDQAGDNDDGKLKVTAGTARNGGGG